MLSKSTQDRIGKKQSFDKSEKNSKKMLVTSFAIAASIAIVLSISLAATNYSLNLSSANPVSDRIAECKEKMLGYEQKGYHNGGASQFNAVIAYCSK